MRILIVGSGGREHALAWKAAQSPRLSHLYVAPGNAGTSLLAENVPLQADNIPGLVSFANEKNIDLVIVGPEAPLAAGLADALGAVGRRVFGPSCAAAQIESSKAFAKSFMARHNIPTAQFKVFTDFDSAIKHLHAVDSPVVIKASGLAAGKGVIVPHSIAEAEDAIDQIMRQREFGSAGDQVVIEERLVGEEISLFAFTDGFTVKAMPPAQDHKRLLDGDRGPNTGGMGAYAPAPAAICPPALSEQLTRTILQPTVDGLRAEGMPFVGVLYAGLMLTSDGPRVLEFNCRFGDPETQVILPLLDTDLIDIAEACANGKLAAMDIRWMNRAAACACIVMAASGYPGKYSPGQEICGLESVRENGVIFHAGTQRADGKIVTAGGRVLGVTAWGSSLGNALATAYAAVERVSFQGAQYRRDIGASLSYRSAGVNISTGNRAVELIRDAVRSTYVPQVLAGIGAFGGLFDAGALKAMREPVLVASTDGIGTKVKLAARARRYQSLGTDIVNHCINDILVHGARPLFFLDYLASSRLDAEAMAQIVTGMAAACRDAGCALLGGEMAEMPGVYQSDAFDVAGTMVGVVERGEILPCPDLRAGDVLIGLPSSGPHTNGYSLIRKIFNGVPLDTHFPELGMPLADALLVPHRSYLPVLQPALSHSPSLVKALVHITGGGFFDNIPRVLPEGLGAVVRCDRWRVPRLFQLIQARGNILTQEMYHVFNMGIGMVVITAPENAETVQGLIADPTWVIGELVSDEKRVTLV